MIVEEHGALVTKWKADLPKLQAEVNRTRGPGRSGTETVDKTIAIQATRAQCSYEVASNPMSLQLGWLYQVATEADLFGLCIQTKTLDKGL